MPEKFPKEEFVKQCIARGYTHRGNCGRSEVLGWCKKHPKDFYTEEDMIEFYRYNNEREIPYYSQFDVGRHESWLCNVTVQELKQKGWYD